MIEKVENVKVRTIDQTEKACPHYLKIWLKKDDETRGLCKNVIGKS